MAAVVIGQCLFILCRFRQRTKILEHPCPQLLRAIEDQTLVLMNRGCSLDQVLHGVKLPTELMEKPYLRPVYDDPRFLIRMVWRRYGGWWDGEFDNLLPAPKADQARATWTPNGRGRYSVNAWSQTCRSS